MKLQHVKERALGPAENTAHDENEHFRLVRHMWLSRVKCGVLVALI